MKRKSIAILLFFAFSLILSVSASAYSGPSPIYDEAGLLSDAEKEELEKDAEILSDRFGCAIAVAFVNSLNGYQSIQDFSDDFYDSNGYGYHASNDGILLTVSMAERKTHLTTTGKAIDIFTDYGLEKTESSFLGYLTNGNYSSAVKSFFSSCIEMCEYYENNGFPYDSPDSGADDLQEHKISPVDLLGSIGCGLALGGVPLRRQKSSMKSVKFCENAAAYTAQSVHLSIRKDRFLRKNLTRVPKPKDESRNSGGFHGGGSHSGSSIHISSSGSSHGGRSGSF